MKQTLSVVIPVYNDETGLLTTLKSLVKQDYSGNFEVIVVDDCSKDKTAEKAEKFAKKHKNIKIVKLSENRGSYFARNKGVKLAKGEIIVLVDADMWVKPDFLTRVAQQFKNPKTQLLANNVKIVAKTNSMAALYDKATGLPAKEYVLYRNFAPTCCLCVRREVFDKIGFFDERMRSGGDSEFSHRAIDAGYSIVFDEENVMFHPARETLKGILKKAFRVGGGFYVRYKLYPERYPEDGKKLTNLQLWSPIPARYIRKGKKSKNTFVRWGKLGKLDKIKIGIVWYLHKLAIQIGYLSEMMKHK